MESEAISLQALSTRDWKEIGKRLFDIFFSLFVLLAASPLFLIIAAGIRLSSPGKIFYIQLRAGKGGKLFRCYKFRTMDWNAELKLEMLLTRCPQLKREWVVKQKLKKDPRIFPFGRILRKTSLDELPQFWNVIKGNMSVVGPRPYMVGQVKELGSFYSKILSVKPGITGLWQTSGRSMTTFQRRIELDAAYVERRTFLFDLFLIFKTCPSIFFPKKTAS